MGRLAPSSHTDVYLEVLETSPNPVSKSEDIPDESRVRMAAFCRMKYWRMASHPTVQAALSDERLLRAGYPTFKMYYHPVFKG